MATIDQKTLQDHQEWIGFLQPEGLVVTAPALLSAQAIIELAPT